MSKLQEWQTKANKQMCSASNRTELEATWAALYTELQAIGVKTATMRAAIRDTRKAISELKPTVHNNKLKLWAIGDNGHENPIFWVRSSVCKMDKQAALTYKATVQLRTEHMIMIDKTITTKQYSELLAICEGWLSSNNYDRVAIAIAAFTGRRIGEVLSTAQFKRVGGNTQAAIFSGQLKKKGGGENFAIPLLCNASKVQAAIKHLRGLIDLSGLSMKDIEKKTNRKLAETLYKLFTSIGWDNSIKEINRGTPANNTSMDTTTITDARELYTLYGFNNQYVRGDKKYAIVPNITVHDLRKLYVAKVLDGKHNRLIVQKLLGHDNMDTGKHYENWQIV